VPDSALSTVILDLGILDLQKGEVIESGNTTKKRSQGLCIFCSLNQDIAGWSQEEKCGLKYVI